MALPIKLTPLYPKTGKLLPLCIAQRDIRPVTSSTRLPLSPAHLSPMGEEVEDTNLHPGLRRGGGPPGCPGSCCAGSAWGPCPPAAGSAGPPWSPGRTPCGAGPGKALSRSLTTGSVWVKKGPSRIKAAAKPSPACVGLWQALWGSALSFWSWELSQGESCALGMAACPRSGRETGPTCWSAAAHSPALRHEQPQQRWDKASLPRLLQLGDAPERHGAPDH